VNKGSSIVKRLSTRARKSEEDPATLGGSSGAEPGTSLEDAGGTRSLESVLSDVPAIVSVDVPNDGIRPHAPSSPSGTLHTQRHEGQPPPGHVSREIGSASCETEGARWQQSDAPFHPKGGIVVNRPAIGSI